MKTHFLLSTLLFLGLTSAGPAAIVGAFWDLNSDAGTGQNPTANSTGFSPVLTSNFTASNFLTTQGGGFNDFTDYSGTTWVASDPVGSEQAISDAAGWNDATSGFIDIAFNATSLQDFTWTAQFYRQGSADVDTDALSYSLDGGNNFTQITTAPVTRTNGSGSSSFGTVADGLISSAADSGATGDWYLFDVDLSGISAIEGASSVVLRYNWSADVGPSGFNNFRTEGYQLTGSVIPEPDTAALLLGGLGMAALLRRRR